MRAFILFTIFVTTYLAQAKEHPEPLEALYHETIETLSEYSRGHTFKNLASLKHIYQNEALTPREKNVTLKAFFDWSAEADAEQTRTVLDLIHPSKRSIGQHLQLYVLKHKLSGSPIVGDDWVLEKRVRQLANKELDNDDFSDLYQLCNLTRKEPHHLTWLRNSDQLIGNVCKLHRNKLAIRPPSRRQLRDLVKKAPDLEELYRGQYKGMPRLYQFCRTDRNYACRLLIMHPDREWARSSPGEVWSMPVLGLSRHDLEFNEFGGDTPAGVYTIDGVMPEANKQHIYGKWRRLIIEFISSSLSERSLLSTLPPSNHTATWWKESVIARDLGRDLLRIHGTLRKNVDPESLHYPFYPTLGCVATRETVYDGVDYRDQRVLLDEMMKAQGLPVHYANETRLKGVLYVIEIDSKTREVTVEDLENLGLL